MSITASYSFLQNFFCPNIWIVILRSMAFRSFKEMRTGTDERGTCLLAKDIIDDIPIIEVVRRVTKVASIIVVLDIVVLLDCSLSTVVLFLLQGTRRHHDARSTMWVRPDSLSPVSIDGLSESLRQRGGYDNDNPRTRSTSPGRMETSS